jgi:hypothetical protein
MADKPYADPPPRRRKLPDDKMGRLLAVVRRRLERATPGPWRYKHDTSTIYAGETAPGEVVAEVHGSQDGTFIAHAHEDILALMAEVERQYAKRDVLYYALMEFKDRFPGTAASREALIVLKQDMED